MVEGYQIVLLLYVSAVSTFDKYICLLLRLLQMLFSWLFRSNYQFVSSLII